MAKSKSKSQSKKNQHTAYKAEGRWAKNKKRKIERHLKQFPNDEVAQRALGNIGSTPKRKTPNNKMWLPSQRTLAQIYASMGINGHHALGNEKISNEIYKREGQENQKKAA